MGVLEHQEVPCSLDQAYVVVGRVDTVGLDVRRLHVGVDGTQRDVHGRERLGQVVAAEAPEERQGDLRVGAAHLARDLLDQRRLARAHGTHRRDFGARCGLLARALSALVGIGRLASRRHAPGEVGIRPQSEFETRGKAGVPEIALKFEVGCVLDVVKQPGKSPVAFGTPFGDARCEPVDGSGQATPII